MNEMKENEYTKKRRKNIKKNRERGTQSLSICLAVGKHEMKLYRMMIKCICIKSEYTHMCAWGEEAKSMRICVSKRHFKLKQYIET